jgi:hypothetical protein
MACGLNEPGKTRETVCPCAIFVVRFARLSNQSQWMPTVMAMSPAQNLEDRPAKSPDAPASVSSEPQTPESLVSLIGATDAGDRRESERHSFPAVQRIAPCRGTAVPTEADFQLVRCHDLSTSGISFYWPTAPNFDQVIVALASPQGTTRVLARVMFHGPQAGPQGQFLIGCRFVRRLSR